MNPRIARLPRIVLIILTTALMSVAVSHIQAVSATPSLGLDGVAQAGYGLTTSNGNDVIIVVAECGYTSCNHDISFVTDSAGLAYSQRIAFAPNDKLWEYYAIAPNPLSSDSIMVTFSGGFGSAIAFAVKGADTATIFDRVSTIPASTPCNGPGPNDCTISATTSSLDLVLVSTAINDAGPCTPSIGFAEITSLGGSLDIDYRIVDSSRNQTTFTCSGTDATAMVLDALLSSEHQSHAPIVISSDSGFTAANGVTGGSGSAQDPYTIEGWEIDGTRGNAIEIRNTDTSFVITDVYLHSETPSWTGVKLDNVTNGNLVDSRITGFFNGIEIRGGGNMTLTNDSVEWNLQGLYLQGPVNMEISNNVLSNNGESNQPIGGPAINAFYLVGVDISNNNLQNDNILIGSSTQFSVTQNTVRAGQVSDLLIYQSTNFEVGGNRVVDRNGFGVVIQSSSSFTVTDNSVVGENLDGQAGIDIFTTSVGVTSGFDVTNNYVYGNSMGISMDRVLDSTVSNNTLTINGIGARVADSNQVTFLENSFFYNRQGLVLNNTRNTAVYHNNFRGDTPLAIDAGGSNNSWDNGYPDGGNFWSAYTGVDNCSGPNQDMCPSPDGIGDTPYVFNYNQDNYPLMSPFQN